MRKRPWKLENRGVKPGVINNRKWARRPRTVH